MSCQMLDEAGAIGIDCVTTFLTSSGELQEQTLADGTTEDQRKCIVLSNGGGDISAKITPATFDDGVSVNLISRMSSVEFEWTGDTWKLLRTTGTTRIE